MFLRLLRWLVADPNLAAPDDLAPRFVSPAPATPPPATDDPSGPWCGACAPDWPCREHAGFGPGEGPEFCACQQPEDCELGCEWLTPEQAAELGLDDDDVIGYFDDAGNFYGSPDDDLPEGYEWVEEDAMGPIGATPEPEPAPDDRPPHPEDVDRGAPALTLHDLDYALAYLARLDHLAAHAAFLDRP